MGKQGMCEYTCMFQFGQWIPGKKTPGTTKEFIIKVKIVDVHNHAGVISVFFLMGYLCGFYLDCHILCQGANISANCYGLPQVVI